MKQAWDIDMFGALLTVLQVTVVDCYDSLSLLPLYKDATDSFLLAVLHSLLQILVALHSDQETLTQQIGWVSISIITTLQQHGAQQTDTGNQGDLMKLLTEAILRENVPGKAAATRRKTLYIIILRLIWYSSSLHLTSSYLRNKMHLSHILAPVQASMPYLVVTLAHDVSNQDLTCRSAATPLLALLIRSDKAGSMIQLLLQQGDLILALLSLLQSVDLTLFEDSAQQQRLAVRQLLSLLTDIATSQAGAVALLSMSIFGALIHCPLLLALRDQFQTLVPVSLPPQHKDILRSILHQFLQLALCLHHAVESIRSVQAELTAFVQALIPLSSLFFKDREGDQELAVDTLGLYLGVLVLLAENREQFSKAMQGYESILKTEVISLLNYVSKQDNCQFICQQVTSGSKLSRDLLKKSKQETLYLIAVENGMLFMSKMGWKIGDEYIRAFGVKE